MERNAEENKESIAITIVIFSAIALICEIYAVGLVIGVVRKALADFGEAPGISLFAYLFAVAVMGFVFGALAFNQYRQYQRQD